ncbi:hypothetical protein KZC51_07590 [Microbacterium sp. SSW1-49]|uniref:DUF5134 domain-containing protein n=1 Tax=Microbacterium croceum TaxID=2851645 RepID=A0ABT0FD51_9MICO|nr:hypothetical protein [Microbacterium croceum]MCK2035997.1 hypothetical protein [Microbacterium croceum]
MSDLLHVFALAAALVGVGSLALMRRGVGHAEIAAAALMVIGMADAMTLALLPPIVWFAVMLPAALALAARCRSPRASRAPAGAESAALTGHLALGLVSTAALILLMTTMTPDAVTAPDAVPPPDAHVHGGGAMMPQLMAGAFGLGAILLGAIALRTERSWVHRLHHATMAASTVAMSAIVIL